jgi:hypothetical protein
MRKPPEQLFSNPDPHLLAFQGDQALFLDMTRHDYHASLFLDQRAVAANPTPHTVPISSLIEASANRQALPIGWIFHIARLIDQVGGALILREPPPLRQLALQHAGGQGNADWHDRLHLARCLAARRFNPDIPTIVKANVPVNFMLPALAEREPSAPAVLLHFALLPYLLAVLRSPNHRDWINRITRLLEPALRQSVGMEPSATTEERAAALWLAQILTFEDHVKSNPNAASLDAEQFFAEPVCVAQAVARHVGIPSAGISTNAEMLLSTYSKNPAQRFSEPDRQARQAGDAIRLDGEIAIARRWIDKSKAVQRLSAQLPRPVLPTERLLLG